MGVMLVGVGRLEEVWGVRIAEEPGNQIVDGVGGSLDFEERVFGGFRM